MQAAKLSSNVFWKYLHESPSSHWVYLFQKFSMNFQQYKADTPQVRQYFGLLICENCVQERNWSKYQSCTNHCCTISGLSRTKYSASIYRNHFCNHQGNESLSEIIQRGPLISIHIPSRPLLVKKAFTFNTSKALRSLRISEQVHTSKWPWQIHRRTTPLNFRNFLWPVRTSED